MQVLNQKKKIKKIKKSQLLLIGSLLVFVGVVCLSFNHFRLLKEQVFEEAKLKMIDTSNPSDDIVVPDVEDKKEEANNPSDPNNSKPSYNFNYIGYLNISRIGLKKGFVSKNSKYNYVDYNVMIAENSDYPDVKNGNFILMAHSGDAYVSYFAYLYKLKLGNIATITYKDVKYKYKLVKIEEQPKTGVVAIHRDNYNTKALTLITCTKDNDNTQTIYIFELV